MPALGEKLEDARRVAALRRTGLLDATPDEGFDRLTRLASRLLHAPVSMVSLRDEKDEFIKSAVGLSPASTTSGATALRYPSASAYCQRVITSGDRLVVADTLADGGDSDGVRHVDGLRSYAGVPLFSPEGHPLGAFCVADTSPREWSVEELEILGELAGSAMTEIGLRVAVLAAEEAQGHLAMLAEASSLLSTLDSADTLEKLARLAVARLADWCSIAVIRDDGSTVERVAIAHRDPTKHELAQQLRVEFPHDPHALTGVPAVIRTGRAQLFEIVDEETRRKTSIGEEYDRLLLTLGFSTAMVVPLAARGRILGAITFARGEGDPYDERDLSVASDLARRAGLALDNARAYETEREIAWTLQRSLLPPKFPDTPHFIVDATYKTPGDTVHVGGDFYDLFPLRGPGWGVAIGDVQGKGPGAASLTALARYTVRAGALTLRNPKQVLRALNEAILREGDDRFLTMCLLTLQPAGGGLRGRVCLAGHPQPLVARADGMIESIGRPGTLLGVVENIDLSVVTFDLRPGDLLVMFTDGLTEARRDGAEFGVRGVVEALRNCIGGSPSDATAVLEKAVTDFAGGLPRDDMAILALGRPLAETPASA